MGLDSPAGLDKIRSESADIVSFTTATISMFCFPNRFLRLLEKPGELYLLGLPRNSREPARICWLQRYFRPCMHRGTRNKRLNGGLQRMFNLLSVFALENHKHTTRNPTIVGKQLIFPMAHNNIKPWRRISNNAHCWIKMRFLESEFRAYRKF